MLNLICPTPFSDSSTACVAELLLTLSLVFNREHTSAKHHKQLTANTSLVTVLVCIPTYLLHASVIKTLCSCHGICQCIFTWMLERELKSHVIP